MLQLTGSALVVPAYGQCIMHELHTAAAVALQQNWHQYAPLHMHFE